MIKTMFDYLVATGLDTSIYRPRTKAAKALKNMKTYVLSQDELDFIAFSKELLATGYPEMQVSLNQYPHDQLSKFNPEYRPSVGTAHCEYWRANRKFSIHAISLSFDWEAKTEIVKPYMTWMDASAFDNCTTSGYSSIPLVKYGEIVQVGKYFDSGFFAARVR